MLPQITYQQNINLSLDQVIELYRLSTLGERRPIDDREVMESMLLHANLTITAWDGPKLVGISRSLTDFAYVCYLADLAVHADYQKKGIGKQLIAETRQHLGKKSKIVLLAAPAAAEYYEKLGFSHNPRDWTLETAKDFPV